MNKFPKEIDLRNKNLIEPKFTELNIERITKLFRNDIYIHLISRKEENDYYDIDSFCKKYQYDRNDFTEILEIIITELQKLGWKTKLSYGDSAIFIYSTQDPPRSCW